MAEKGVAAASIRKNAISDDINTDTTVPECLSQTAMSSFDSLG
jgi:hypothetical protein